MLRTLQWKLVFMFVTITLLLMTFVYVFLNYGIAPIYYKNFVNAVNDGFESLDNLSGNKEQTNAENLVSKDNSKRIIALYNLHISFPLNDNFNLTIFDLEEIYTYRANSIANSIEFSNDPHYASNYNREQKEQFENEILLNSENLLKLMDSIKAGKDFRGEIPKNTNALINTSNRDYYEYLRIEGDHLYYFIYNSEAWKDITSSFNNIIVQSSVLAICIALMLGYILSKTITGPIVNIMHKAQKLAAGDFEQSIIVRSDDEIGKLSKAFNYMAKELKNTMTEQQRLENMRREFVANVSHELKTPITSIKSYAETLLDGGIDDFETTVRFLEVINTEADRMTRLVRDLLQLSRIDNAQMKWSMKPFNITALIANVTDRLQMEVRNKEQTLNFKIKNETSEITGDRDRLEQVFVNVITNAIKYTPKGGSIDVNIEQSEKVFRVKVSDTGVGIPEADIPRIFERFYRVDKARSRDMGGTGLGLAIAKEIIEAHGGGIYAKSTVDKGTEIVIELPVTHI